MRRYDAGTVPTWRRLFCSFCSGHGTAGGLHDRRQFVAVATPFGWSNRCKLARPLIAGGGFGPTAKNQAHNPAVAGSNPIPATCFDGSETRYRRVIRKAGVERRRPFRVLSPVLATTSASREVSVCRSRPVARDPRPPWRRPADPFRPKLSVVSLSRAAGLTGVASASTAHNPLGLRCGKRSQNEKTRRPIS